MLSRISLTSSRCRQITRRRVPSPRAKCERRLFSVPSAASSDGNVFDRITFIGTGKMAQAMVSPLISQSLQNPSSITAFDVSESALKRVNELFPGVKTASSIPEAVDNSNLIVYCVKPQNCSLVHSEIRRAKSESGIVRDDAILLSVVAGVPMSNFLQSSVTRIARSMPNTPAQIGAGVTVWSCTENIDLTERNQINQILNSFGKTVSVDDESFIDMSTSISGSGPAYV